jgi:membrane protease YdiL (CAAX protease family)
MAQSLARRWPTAVLLLWLPLVKWGLPPGWPRVLLFFAGGSALAALAVWRERDGARVRPLFRAPLSGLLRGLYGYALLVAVGTVLLYLRPLQPILPSALLDLATLFDPAPVYLAFGGDAAWPSAGTLAAIAAGSLAEEWMFRVALFWRWLPARDAEGPPRLLPRAGALLRLAAVSAYFAALHWPQPPGALLVALLGGLAVGWLLLWQRSYVTVATLHVLFNWRLLF